MAGTRLTGRRMLRFGIVVTLLVALSGRFEPIRAQIYEWTDDAGDRHFDTSLEQVPEERRPQARIVIPAETPGIADAESDASPSTAEPNTAESEADDSFDAGWDAGFGAGWEAGYRAAVEEQPVSPAEPPTVVFESRPPVILNVPPYDPSGAYYRSPYGGSLTVPFDDGASRGLTSRNLIQERRAFERGW